MSVKIVCHHCLGWIGEAPFPLHFVGVFRYAEDRKLVPDPRYTYRCKTCSWVTVFRSGPPDARSSGEWRELTIK